jgi:translation initiation factor 6 (eIF-6)
VPNLSSLPVYHTFSENATFIPIGEADETLVSVRNRLKFPLAALTTGKIFVIMVAKESRGILERRPK